MRCAGTRRSALGCGNIDINYVMTEPEPSPAFTWTHPSDAVGAALTCPPLGASVRHLFTSHHLQLRDDPAEWQAVAAALGLPPTALRLIKQVHRADVAVVRRDDGSPWTVTEADIILTDDPDVVVAVRVADCAPILLVDPERRAVAAIHAGWRGTMQRAAQVGTAAMTREFGSAPEELVAAIGPCLGVCCGEVGDEVVEAFRSAGHPDAAVERWFALGPGGRAHLRLARANRDQLEAAGLRAANIHDAELCTRSYPDVFHSYRAAGPNAGRMVALIRCP